MAIDPRRLAILGAGRIGESLLSGLLTSGWREPAEVVVSGRREDRLRELAEQHGVTATLSNAEAIAGAALVVISVKPQDYEVLLGEIGGLLEPSQTVLSIMAAIPTSAIESTVCSGETSSPISPSSGSKSCGLTASTTSALPETASGFESVASTL